MKTMRKLSKPKEKRVRAWAVICNRLGFSRAFMDKTKARMHKDFLNKEYTRKECRHIVVPATISFPSQPAKNKKS